jgi:hypothetical protein
MVPAGRGAGAGQAGGSPAVSGGSAWWHGVVRRALVYPAPLPSKSATRGPVCLAPANGVM